MKKQSKWMIATIIVVVIAGCTWYFMKSSPKAQLLVKTEKNCQRRYIKHCNSNRICRGYYTSGSRYAGIWNYQQDLCGFQFCCKKGTADRRTG